MFALAKHKNPNAKCKKEESSPGGVSYMDGDTCRKTIVKTLNERNLGLAKA